MLTHAAKLPKVGWRSREARSWMPEIGLGCWMLVTFLVNQLERAKKKDFQDCDSDARYALKITFCYKTYISIGKHAWISLLPLEIWKTTRESHHRLLRL